MTRSADDETGPRSHLLKIGSSLFELATFSSILSNSDFRVIHHTTMRLNPPVKSITARPFSFKSFLFLFLWVFFSFFGSKHHFIHKSVTEIEEFMLVTASKLELPQHREGVLLWTRTLEAERLKYNQK